MTDEKIPVLIVGGGYAGLTASLFLANQGVRSVLVDRHPGISIQGRARGINPRTMEIYRPLGIANAVRGAGAPFVDDRGVAFCQTLDSEWRWIVDEDAPTAYPGWSAGEFVLADQSSVEPILVDAARARGASQRFNTQLLSFEADADGVTAVLEDRKRGTRSSVRADYMIAADGNRSSIREQLGIARSGPGLIRHFVSIVFDADLSDVVRRRALFWIIANPALGADGASFVTTATPGRWAVAVFRNASAYDAALDAPAAYTNERCIDVVRTVVGQPDLGVHIVDVAGWEESVGVADSFAQGRVFLVGDSAHTWPPAGAMGANSAVHDAHNLAWKLAAVVNGWAAPKLLGSYSAERRPVALELSRITTRRQQARFGQGSDPDDVDDLVCILGQRYQSAAIVDSAAGPVFGDKLIENAQPGLRAPHLWLLGDGQRMASHDLFSNAFTLLTGSAGGEWCAASAEVSRATRVPLNAYRVGSASEQVDLVDLDDRWCSCGLGADGAMLVRPDGYVAWQQPGATADPRRALVSALRIGASATH
jgi:2-polyprenyl-6-methoxyphenol hydroxylase-like FAD-dependent oxidoreductase